MKKILLLLTLITTAITGFSQDLSDQKYFSSLKNIKYYTKDKDKYAAILANGWFLDVKYNVVVAGEYNASYTFLKVTNDLMPKTDAQTNYNLLLKHLPAFCTVLNLPAADVAKIKTAVSQHRGEFAKKEVIVSLDMLKGYDECLLVFKNTGDVISCRLFFRRLM